MDNRKFDPTSDLPKCDICGATMLHFTTLHSCEGAKYVVTFSCEARWTAARKLDFRRSEGSIPDGMFTLWKDSHLPSFLEDVPCKNAARIARKLRDEAKVPVNKTWRDSRPEDEQATINRYVDDDEHEASKRKYLREDTE